MKLISIEGPDGVGKSTLVQNLKAYYGDIGLNVEYVHFPRYGTRVGQVIKDVLFSHEKMDPRAFQMLYSADRINFTKISIPQFEEYMNILLVDRYISSGMVYGQLGGINPKDILFFEKDVRKPDINIILTASVKTLVGRMNYKIQDMFETYDNMKKVVNYYNNVNKYLKCKHSKIIETDDINSYHVYKIARAYINEFIK